jgi:hypothetical protein
VVADWVRQFVAGSWDDGLAGTFLVEAKDCGGRFGALARCGLMDCRITCSSGQWYWESVFFWCA